MSELSQQVRRRRTFAIISHPDAGKTTLTEKLLLFSGAINIAGSVKARKAARHATSDWMEIEKQRGISVASSVMQMEYRDCVINLLDTPGHQDFSEDTYRVLTAVDAALMVIDAGNGVEPQTRRLLQVCRARNTPILTFVNKMDREVQQPLDLMDEIERELGMTVVPFTWPVGMGKTFRGVYDRRTDQMRVFAAGEDRRGGDEDVLAGLDNPESLKRFGSARATHSVDVGERDGHPLIAGQVDAYETCHGCPLLLLARGVVAAPVPSTRRGPRPLVRGWRPAACTCRLRGSGTAIHVPVGTWWACPGCLPSHARRTSALALLVTDVVADDHDPTVTTDHLALVADLLDACLDLHRNPNSLPDCCHLYL